ncbi:cysteine--tRNA ligase [Limisalsivibrio acetivorans]|uniref:cysteine--tRNA ligase n=1 Tax=Limisalsivibrio acetivorans TaxID=1304888 RepID=UPI0003B38014|nr:cysteine--tRNA ligase [Limisalsivibrio acetivorans]
MLKLYNSLTKQKEDFTPHSDKNVNMYVCGVTVYDFCHIGHARSSVVFDVIRRYMLYSGYNVNFVKNFTDIDDKIIKRSGETGMDWRDLTKKYIDEHDQDMTSLGILPPTHTPKATDFIDEMITMCQTLIERGHAYEADGDIYFRVNSFEGYGKLSGRSLDEMLAGARVEVSDKKENPYDFVLWKASKEGEPSWDSPWGPGRPGWHIECSVMSEKILGLPFDIHGGGRDLIFPHHENEIAQSEAYSGNDFVKYWMHNGFVNINEEKMSKSLGNFFTIRDVTNVWDPEIIRYFLLTTHYRSSLDFSDYRLVDAESSLDRIYTAIDEINSYPAGKKGQDLSEDARRIRDEFINDFCKAMDDDFNTPIALAALFEAVRGFNRLLSEKPNKACIEEVRSCAEDVFKAAREVLGITVKTPQEWFRANLSIPEEELNSLITERNEARKNKDFAKADEIRNKLTEKGIELLDTPEGTRFRAKKIRELHD